MDSAVQKGETWIFLLFSIGIFHCYLKINTFNAELR